MSSTLLHCAIQKCKLIYMYLYWPIGLYNLLKSVNKIYRAKKVKILKNLIYNFQKTRIEEFYKFIVHVIM